MTTNLSLTQSIGQAENALRAILEKILAQSGVTFVQWAMFNMIARGESPVQQDQLVRQVAGALKIGEQTILAALDEIASRELVTAHSGDPVRIALTPAGEEQFHMIRQDVSSVTARLYSDLSEDELATTRRILGIITERANVELNR